MLKNTEESYGLVARIFHWLVGLMIIIVIIVGYTMADMEPSDQKWALYNGHKATGVVILMLVSMRFLWKLSNKTTLLPADIPAWQKLAAKTTYFILYVLMFLMPISGLLMSLLSGHPVDVYGLFTIDKLAENKPLAMQFHSIHVFSSFILTAFVVLHISAAWYHHLIRKDNVLMRMIKG